MKTNIDIDDIQIEIKLLKSEWIKAQAVIVLFGKWREKGWKIVKSKEEHPTFHDYIWIQSPCFNANGKWQEIVYIDDRRLYEEVQAKIFDAYTREKSKDVAINGSEEINLDEIDKHTL